MIFELYSIISYLLHPIIYIKLTGHKQPVILIHFLLYYYLLYK
nr:MAG TPA: hypothetical protein [Caudoviricetes sp.]